MRHRGILIGAAVAVLATLAMPAANATASAVLLINDTNGVGTVGDRLLSLDEGIRLGNGALQLAALSPEERAQVHGIPGAASADTLRVVLGREGVISAPASAPLTPGITAIRGNTGDTLDGGGMLLHGDAPTGIGLMVASSGFRLHDVAMSGFNEDVVLDFGGQHLHDIAIDHVTLHPATNGNLTVGARSSNGSLSGLRVTDSQFIGGATTDSTQPVVLSGMYTRATAEVHDALLEGVEFARNEVSGGFEGFYVYGAVANGGLASRGVVRHVRILDNYFHDASDAAMNLDGGTGIVNTVTDSGIEDIVMSGNRIEANGWGIGIWGGEAFGASAVERNFVRGVTVTNNQIIGLSDTTQCLIVEAGRVDFAGVARDNTISDVRLSDNRASGCAQSGITVFGGVAVAGGVVTGNAGRNVVVERNSFAGAPLGIVLRGASTTGASYASGNAVESLRFASNTVTATDQGIRMVGGESSLPGVNTQNAVRDVTFRRNVIQAPVPCIALADAGPGAVGNLLGAACPR
jgi:hypothetical protein